MKDKTMTQADVELVQAMDRTRGLLSANIVDIENMPSSCIADLLTISRWAAENAARLRMVGSLKWESSGNYHWSDTPLGRAEVVLIRNGLWKFRVPDSTFQLCDSLKDGKAKAQAWYEASIDRALVPAFPTEKELQK